VNLNSAISVVSKRAQALHHNLKFVSYVYMQPFLVNIFNAFPSLLFSEETSSCFCMKQHYENTKNTRFLGNAFDSIRKGLK